MRRILFILSLLLSLIRTYGQTFSLELQTGSAVYVQEDLMRLQIDLTNQLDRNIIEIMEQFPENVCYTFNLNYIYPRTLVGFDFSYLTTGGRNHVKDYSGEYKLDMILNGYRFGLHAQRMSEYTHRLSWGLKLTAGGILTQLNVDEKIHLFNINDDRYADGLIYSEDMDFSSFGPFIQPSTVFFYRLTDKLLATAEFGYEYDYKQRLHKTGDQKKYLRNSKGDVYSDWSGIRCMLGISYIFHKPCHGLKQLFCKKGTNRCCATNSL